jgi:hypothetical protein
MTAATDSPSPLSAEVLERRPASVWPLASFVCEEMQARGWNTDDVAMRMGSATDEEFGTDLLAFGFLMSVQDDGLLIGDEMFRKLSLAFGASEDYFRNLDSAWRNAPPDRREPFDCPDEIYGPLLKASGPPTEH